MSKIAFLADLHFGHPTRAEENYKAALLVAEEIYAQREYLHDVFILGDFLHSQDISVRALAQINTFLDKFGEDQCIRIIAGNHDEYADGETYLSAFKKNAAYSAYVEATKDHATVEVTHTYDRNATVYLMSHKHIPCKNGKFDHSGDLARYNKLVELTKREKEDTVKILAGHGVIDTMLKKAGTTPENYGGSTVFPESCKDAFDYVVLGHNHVPFVMDNYISVGSLTEQRDEHIVNTEGLRGVLYFDPVTETFSRSILSREVIYGKRIPPTPQVDYEVFLAEEYPELGKARNDG
jgi:DNA repair exonuclease SbcCD nuclease subunit